MPAFGVEFMDMADEDWKRLCTVMRELEQRDQRRRERSC